VAQFHEWMRQYCSELAPVFPVRAVPGTLRQQVYSTVDGTQIAPADNSPAWVVHALLVERRLSSYQDFRDVMSVMPTHMFDVPKFVRKYAVQTPNDFGWYVAHVVPAKNRDTNFRSWNRQEVERRFYLTFHPCNLFLVPGVRNRQIAEDAAVIRFIAGQYSKRYDAIWVEFVDRVRAIMDPPEPKFGASTIVFNSLGVPKVSVSDSSNEVLQQLGPVKVSYRASRLTFKRDCIEPLNWEDIFEVITPVGTYRFTKQDFYAEFPNIPKTESYRDRGSYHGKTLHLKAQRFRVDDSVDDRD
jgi:hypothetical protein